MLSSKLHIIFPGRDRAKKSYTITIKWRKEINIVNYIDYNCMAWYMYIVSYFIGIITKMY